MKQLLNTYPEKMQSIIEPRLFPAGAVNARGPRGYLLALGEGWVLLRFFSAQYHVTAMQCLFVLVVFTFLSKEEAGRDFRNRVSS